MKGKIIAVVGAPGCGKSFLVRKLAKYYDGVSILEGESLPKYIMDGLKKRDRNFPLFIWWRNKLVKEMFLAKKLSARKTVIMDNFWFTNETYCNYFFKGFERKIAADLSHIDKSLIPYPDIMLFLKTSQQQTREFVSKRGRSHEIHESFLKMTFLVEKEHGVLLKNLKNVYLLNREGLDFNKKSDLKIVVDGINKTLKSS